MNKLSAHQKTYTAGFTLIEISIVLVIIGLIIGGVLVGRDLIRSAEIRAQISQIEKYNTAVNTFKLKYSHLPGDIPEPHASGFGFSARGIYKGTGDGNGVLEGLTGAYSAISIASPIGIATGETILFFADLLNMTGNISNIVITCCWALNFSDLAGLTQVFPFSKINSRAFVYITSFKNLNYIAVSKINTTSGGMLVSASPALSVLQAYSIDTKIDDGIPGTGKVLAIYTGGFDQSTAIWSNGAYLSSISGSISTSATPSSTTTCYDNNNSVGIQPKYSVEQDGGSNINCAIAFQFQ